MQVWRANTESSITFNLIKVTRYTTKYIEKSEVQSNACVQAYKEVFEKANIQESHTHKCLKTIMMKVLGQRDISIFEESHQLLGLPLHGSNINVVSVNLLASNEIIKDKDSEELSLGLK